MLNKLIYSLCFVFMTVSTQCNADSLKTIEVFYKNKSPSLQTLEKTNALLEKFKDKYTITHLVITDVKNKDRIKKYNLPVTHFPFAVVINGKYSAEIDKNKIDFVGFPLFMKGIGRHEGNWSLNILEKVLNDNALLLDHNSLPEPVHDGKDDPCPE